MSDPVDDPERPGDRAGGKEKRDRHREGESEDRQQDEQRDRKRDHQLAVAQIGVENGIEIVLNRRRAGDIHVLHPRGATEGAEHGVRIALGLRHRQRRVDIPVDDELPARGARDVERRRRSRRHDGNRAGDSDAQRKRLGRPGSERAASCGELEDDGEGTVRAVTELLLKEVSHVLGVGAGHGETVGEKRREPRTRAGPEDEHDKPEDEHSAAMPQHKPRPACHARRVSRPG